MRLFRRARKLGKGTQLLRAASYVVLAAGALSALAPGAPHAAADQLLSISTSPALTPAFDPSVTDYVARCGTSLTTPTTITVSVSAPAGTKVSVAGSAPKSGSFTASVSRAWDQSFPFAVVVGGSEPVTYFVRCFPTDAPGIGTIRSGTSAAAYYVLSALSTVVRGGSTGGFSVHYLDVVDTNGVPMWWYDAGLGVGDAKVLANGNIAWYPGGGALTERTFAGSLVATVQIPDNPPADFHDFALLPNGDWLMAAYPKVSGVDLSSIGGASNTCVTDAEVEEVTPAGALVWSWFASQHVSPTEISANVQPAVNTSTCTTPKDIWHLNAIQPLGSDFLVSLRQTNAVFRVNVASGNVVWKLGGTPTPQSLTMSGDPLNGFIGQHDARSWPDGSVSVFDNGTDSFNPPGVRRARVVRYQIDTVAHTATMAEQIVDPYVSNPAGSFCCGSARRLPGGSWAIGYGFQGINTEVTASGSRVLSMNFNDPSTDPANPAPALFSYRMTPVLPGVLTRNELRAGMDAQHPVADSTAPAVASNAADNTCSQPGKNGWCRGTQTAGFDAFDNAAGLSASLCASPTRLPACGFTVKSTKDGPKVTIPSGRVCDMAPTPNCTATSAPATAGPFRIDRTPPRITATATTADGKPYRSGTATTQSVKVHFACTDATSGIATHGCPGDVDVAAPTGSGRVVKGTAADKAGNTATVDFRVGQTAPTAPRRLSAGPFGHGAARVTWVAPSTNGGSGISAYIVTPYVGTKAQSPRTLKSTATSAVISGLVNGTAYTFRVAARNAIGTGPSSKPSVAIIVGAPRTPTSVGVTRTAAGTFKITFAGPADDGASITGYTATCTSSDRGATRAKTGPASPITLSGLTAGRTYRCTVSATNSRGTGLASSPSRSVVA